MPWFNSRYHRFGQIQQLDPVTDHCRICHLLAGYEFPWDTTRSLELAMLKTYCVPSISQLLEETGEFHHHTQKRYDDTGLLVAEILKWGYDGYQLKAGHFEQKEAKVGGGVSVRGRLPLINPKSTISTRLFRRLFLLLGSGI